MAVKMKTAKRAKNDTENDSEETESSNPETSTTSPSESFCEHRENSNVYGALNMKCPKCFWHDYYKICPICDHQMPEKRNYIKEGFLRCHDCGAIKGRTKMSINFSFLQIAVYLTLFVTVFQ